MTPVPSRGAQGSPEEAKFLDEAKEIAKKLTEYSYETIASIIDEGIQKKYYVTLEPYENPQIKKTYINNKS